MSVRTFTVFQDTPSIDTSKPRVTSHPETPSISTSILPATTLASLTEKENVHPLTGEPTGPNVTSKKRKTTVLATKVHMPLTIKKQADESANPRHEAKKRKSASSSSLKTKSTLKKDGKSSGSGRKASKRSTRKVSPLPKVEEEVVERERAAQAHIDSRCYELTVKPLADVTPAYEQCPALEDIILGEKAKLRFAKGSSAEPDIRDYFSSPLSSSATSKPVCTSSEIKSFSTPEKKQIYSSFTFSSPSPSGKRFSTARSSASPSP